MIEVYSEKLGVGVQFPTGLDEVCPKNQLNLLTDNIVLSPYYCLVMICFQTKLSSFCLSLGGKSAKDKNEGMVVTPILAKISPDDAISIHCNVGNVLCIDRSTIERGIHVHIPTMISYRLASSFFMRDDSLRTVCAGIANVGDSAKDSPVKDLVTGERLYPSKVGNIIIVEFKIIPINAIAGNFDSNGTIFDPFLVSNNVGEC